MGAKVARNLTGKSFSRVTNEAGHLVGLVTTDGIKADDLRSATEENTAKNDMVLPATFIIPAENHLYFYDADYYKLSSRQGTLFNEITNCWQKQTS